ncbi:MAG: hypothetical protein ABJA66_04510 [Actinomycetota bacterium]
MIRKFQKRVLPFAVALIFLSGALAVCAAAQTADLSTDKAVIAELQKTVDARDAKPAKGDEKLEAKRKAASRLDAKDVCIKRLKESTKVIVIGFFRTDVGCYFDGVFIDSRYFERDGFDLSKIALAALGWKKAIQIQRENLAKIWVEKALLAFAPLPNQTLSAVSTSDGKIKVTASSKYPPGVTSRTETKKFVFDKDGGLYSGGDY